MLSSGHNQKVIDVNVGGTRNSIDLCLRRGAKKLVYCSSTGAIPEKPKGQAIRAIGYFTRPGYWAATAYILPYPSAFSAR